MPRKFRAGTLSNWVVGEGGISLSRTLKDEYKQTEQEECICKQTLAGWGTLLLGNGQKSVVCGAESKADSDNMKLQKLGVRSWQRCRV